MHVHCSICIGTRPGWGHYSTAQPVKQSTHLRNRAEATQLTFMAYQTAMTDTDVISSSYCTDVVIRIGWPVARCGVQQSARAEYRKL